MGDHLINARKRLSDRSVDIDVMKYTGEGELILTQGDFCDAKLFLPTTAKRRCFILNVRNEEDRINNQNLMHIATFARYEKELEKSRQNFIKTSKLNEFNNAPLNLSKFGYYNDKASEKFSALSIHCQTEVSKNEISLWESNFKELEKVKQLLENVKSQLRDAKYELDNVRKIRHNTDRREKRSKVTCEKLRKELEGEKSKYLNEYDELVAYYENLMNESNEQRLNDAEMIKDLQSKCNIQQQDACKLKDSETNILEICDNKRYTDSAKFVFAQLKQCNVADEMVGKVIQIVLSLVNMKANVIPSATTVARSSFLTKVLTKEHLFQELKRAAERGIPLTICTDETTKKAKKEQAYITRTLDENNKPLDLLVAVRRVLDKGSWTSFLELQDVIKDIGGKYLEGNEMWKMFVLAIGHRMSDKAGTEIKFTDYLCEAKQEIVETEARYANLSEQEKKELAQISSFFCQLHVIQNCADIILKALAMHEKDLRQIEHLPKTTVMCAITEITRYLAERASSKWMVKPKWEEFALHNNLKYYSIPDLIGHRFNIILSIAGTVFPLKDDIIKFMDDHKTCMNNTLIKDWLKDPIVLTHLQIMALINVLITGPYLRLTENTDMKSLGDHAQALIIFLERLQKEPLLLLSGETPFYDFPESYPKTDRSKYHAEVMLEVPPLFPELAIDAVELIAQGLTDYFKKQFADFLLGGKYHNVDFNTATVPRSNRKCEMIFGFTGWTHNYAPNMRLVRREMRVQASVNRTFEWIMKKPLEERIKLIRQAVAEAYLEEKAEHNRDKQLQEAFWRRMQEQQADEITLKLGLEKKQATARKNLEKYGGPWVTVEQMQNHLETLTEKEKELVVTANIRYQKVHTKHTDKKLTTMSRNRRSKPLDELLENMKILLNLNLEQIGNDEFDDNI